MKAIRRIIAGMTAGLLCLAGTPALTAEYLQAVSLTASAVDEETSEIISYTCLDNMEKQYITLNPDESYQLEFDYIRYISYMGNEDFRSYHDVYQSEFLTINHDYDQGVIQVDDQTGIITAGYSTGRTTSFTVEDTQGNTVEIEVNVLAEPPEFLDQEDINLTMHVGEEYQLQFNYLVNYPVHNAEYGFDKDVHFIANNYDASIITADRETGKVTALAEGTTKFTVSDPQMHRITVFVEVLPAEETTTATETTMTTTETTTSVTETTTSETTSTTETTTSTTETTRETTTSQTTSTTMTSTTASETTSETTAPETVPATETTETTIPETIPATETTETTETTAPETVPVTETTTETTVPETTATEETTTENPENDENLPDTGMPLVRVAECSALALFVGGAVMVAKSRKKED